MKKYRKIIVVILLLLVLIGLCYWGNNSLVLSEYTYSSYKVKNSLDNYNIVQVSDLHNKEFKKENTGLVTKIKEAKPDIIVITGDLIDSNHTDMDVAIRFVKQIVKIAPVYYVSGNHETYIEEEEYQQFIQELEQCGMINLDDSSVQVEDNFYLIGLSEHSIQNESDTLEKLVKGLPKDSLKILLAHEPQKLDFYAKSKVDIVLSGHAHGGQFRNPFTDQGLIAPDQGLFPKYTSGKHLVDNTAMFISRGLGNSIIPIRIFNRPEIVKLVLEESK